MSLIKAITNNTTLTTDNIRTFLTSDTAAGVTSLTVKNLTGFATNQVLVLGPWGNEGTEIVYVSSVSGSSTINLTATTLYPHSASSPIIVIDFDQVEFSWSVTTTGSKTVLSTVNITVDVPDFTRYNDTTQTTGYYFIRFKNSVTSAFSLYSDPIPVTGYTPLTARYIIDAALNAINQKTSAVLTDTFAYTEINNCQMEVLRELKRWSWMQVFDYILGQITTGQWRIAVPTDMDDQNTDKSIYNLRLGRETQLTWIDKEKWNEFIDGVAYSTLTSAINVGSTSIVLTNSSDFPSTGTVTIGANSYSYTANNTGTNTLTISASTTTNNIGDFAFYGAQVGLPRYFTVFGGYFYFYPILSSTFNGRNMYADYYKALTQITTDSTTIVLPDPLAVQYYLEWKFLKKLNNGEDNNASLAAMNNYIQRREKLKQKETLGRTFKWKPRYNDWATRSEFNYSDSKRTRLGNFPDA